MQNIFLSVFLILATSVAGIAQRFIEVTVSDTVLLKSTNFIYEITFGEQESYQHYGYEGNYYSDKDIEDVEEDDVVPTISEITALLDNGRFTYTIDSQEDYSISNSLSHPSVLVTLRSEPELKKLYQVLKDQKGITGNLKEVNYESITMYHNKLYRQLYEKALKKASNLAKISGNEIGQLISATDNPQGSGGISEFYEELMKLAPKGLYNADQVMTKTEKFTMTFKFELL